MWWTVTQALRYCSCSSSDTIRGEQVDGLDTNKKTTLTRLSTTTAATASPSLSLQPWQSYRLYCVYLAVTTALLLAIVFLWVVQRVERARQRRALLRHMMTAATRTSRSRTTATMALTAASTSTWLALYGVTFVRPATSSSSSSCSLPMYGCNVRDRCIICFAATALRPLALLPCGHCQMCTRCVAALWRHGGTQQCLRCPLCRQRVDCVCPAILIDASTRNNNNNSNNNSNNDDDSNSGSSRSNDDGSAECGVGAVECRDDATAAAAVHTTKDDNNDNNDNCNDDDDDDDDDKNTMSVADEVLFVREYNKRFRRRRRMRWLCGGGGGDDASSGDGSNVTRTAIASAAATTAAAAATAPQVHRARDVRTHTARTVRDHSRGTSSDHDGDVVDAHDSDVCWHERCVRVLRCITNARYLPTIVAVRISLLHLTMIAFLLMPQDVLPTIYMPSSRSSSIASSSGNAAANAADTTRMPQATTTTTMPVVTVCSSNNNYTNISGSNGVVAAAAAAAADAVTAAAAPTATMTACVDEVRGSANAVSAMAAATTIHDAAVLWLTCARQRVLRLLGVAVEAIMQCTDDVFLFVFCIVLLGHVLLRSLFDDAMVE